MARALLACGIVALIAGAPAAFAQTQPPSSQPATIVDFDFRPREMTIPVNTTVEWTNRGARPHTATDRGGTFDTNQIAPNGSASITFTVPGRYEYFCRINPGSMNAVIVVEPGEEPVRVTRVQALDPDREDESLRFDPEEMIVDAGSTIVFANVGGKPHTLTADDGSFDTGVVTPGAEGGRFAGSNATITLSQPGVYPFHCEIHPAAMTGVVTVAGEARAGPLGASSAPRRLAVDVRDFAFDPVEASVAPGGEIAFTNRGQAPHTATFDDQQLDTDNVAPGAEVSLTAPDRPGSYSYRCNIHPDRMRAVLVVVGQNIADPTQPLALGAAATGAGPGGGVTALALVTGMIGAFLGGFAISAFVRSGMGGSKS